MYETFYGLKERPFSLLPDPDYLYLSPKHMRALTLLEYGMMNQAGFSVICGDTGAGKTTLIRRLLTELGEDTTVGLITNTHKSFGELLSWVLMAFGLDGENKSKANMHQMLIEFLIDQYAQNRHTVLIVDEAQNMTADTLEELRMLSNINSDKDQVLQVILAGQPALRETLRKPELMQFAQRIAVDYYLESLNRDETCEYIQHRLEVAGGSADIFTEAACHEVYRYSGGTPRLINLLCDTALVYGFAEQTPVIDAPLIEDVVREQHRNSIVPTFNKPMDEDRNRPHKAAATVDKRAKDKAAASTQSSDQIASAVQHVSEQPVVINEAEMATRSQHAAAEYNSAVNMGHTEKQGAPIKSESVSISKPHIISEPVTQDDEPHPPVNKVTHIKKPPVKTADTHEPEASVTAHSTVSHNKDESPMRIEKRRQSDKPGSDHMAERAASASHQQTASEPDNLEARFTEEDTTEQTAYKDVYPIVHIADEPKKNFNFLVLGILGGMVLSLLMFMAAWMMFRQDAPPQTTQTLQNPQLSTPDPTPIAPTADEQHRLAEIQRERDEARATAEELIRERDAALAAAQKQEAIRSAEKRANEILAVQERKYANEMERIRQRAFEAEIAAAKARERERIANEEAERARQEASRTPTAAPLATLPTTAVTPAPATQHNEAEHKPAASGTRTDTSASETTDTKFSANPCNSPSAKFLSTCKK